MTRIRNSSHPIWSDSNFIPFSISVDCGILILNLLLIYAALRQKRRRWGGVDEIVISFSVIEIITILIILPLVIVRYISGSWLGDIYTCSLYQSTLLFCEIASVSFITILALERITTVKRVVAGDIAFKTGDNVKTRVKIGFALVIATLFAICPLIKLGPSGFAHHQCQSVFIVTISDKNEQTVFLLFLMYGYLSFIAWVVLYLALIVQLYNLRNRQKSTDDDSAAQCPETNAEWFKYEQEEVFNTSIAVVIVAGVFYATWIPFLVVIPLHKLVSSISDRAVEVCLLASSLGGVLLPLILLTLCKTYRMECMQLFKRLCCCFKKQFNHFVYENTLNDQASSNPEHDVQFSTGRNGKLTITTRLSNSNHDTQPSTSDSQCLQAVEYGFSNAMPADGEDYEETTYITHNSDEEDNNVCTAGSQLSLVSSDEGKNA